MEKDVQAPSTTGSPLWRHSHPQSTQISQFQKHIEITFGKQFKDYEDLRQWSINNINAFWQQVWRFTGVVASSPFFKVFQAKSSLQALPQLIYTSGCR